MASTSNPTTSSSDPSADTAFPRSGAPAMTSPSSASPGTPATGGSGSRAAAAAEAAIDTAAAERDVIRRVVQGAHEAVDRLADKAIPAVERLKATYDDATESIKERAGQAADLKDEWTESVRSAVREHPLAAVGIALAVGAILARLTADNDR